MLPALPSRLVGPHPSACILLQANKSSVIQAWHVVVGYLVINAFAFMWNCYARWLPVIAQVSLFTSLISFFVILVVVPAKASPHQDARFVFANFVNGTGWSQNGIGELMDFPCMLELSAILQYLYISTRLFIIFQLVSAGSAVLTSHFILMSQLTVLYKYCITSSPHSVTISLHSPYTPQLHPQIVNPPANPSSAFIVGLINTNYAFACLDCATHLAEEVHRPERQVPIAIMGTVAIGFLTSWFYSIALFFSMGSLADLSGTATLVPLLQLFDQALRSVAGAIVLESLFIATGIWCLVASHTWQSRLCWSFARDGGLPFSGFLSHVDARVDVPLRAHGVSCFIVAVLGLLYLGSYTAFNSMVTACIVLLYISYAIPVICLLVKGRGNIRHGPFWLGGVGLFSNVVLLLWTVFTLVMYSFPPVRPVVASSEPLPLSSYNYPPLLYPHSVFHFYIPCQQLFHPTTKHEQSPPH